MSTIRDEELSALLDGELNPERAKQVRQELAATPELHARFTRLERLHEQLSLAAEDASFEPRIILPSAASRPGRAREWIWAPATAVLLLALRIVPKIASLQVLGVALQFAVLAAVVLLLVKFATATEFNEGVRA